MSTMVTELAVGAASHREVRATPTLICMQYTLTSLLQDLRVENLKPRSPLTPLKKGGS